MPPSAKVPATGEPLPRGSWIANVLTTVTVVALVVVASGCAAVVTFAGMEDTQVLFLAIWIVTPIALVVMLAGAIALVRRALVHAALRRTHASVDGKLAQVVDWRAAGRIPAATHGAVREQAQRVAGPASALGRNVAQSIAVSSFFGVLACVTVAAALVVVVAFLASAHMLTKYPELWVGPFLVDLVAAGIASVAWVGARTWRRRAAAGWSAAVSEFEAAHARAADVAGNSGMKAK